MKVYEKDPSLQVSSYDVVAPPWAYCPDVEFDAQDRLPTVLGEFVWTGFDYLGEPTPYGEPRETGRPAVHISASSTSQAFRRTATTSIRARWTSDADGPCLAPLELAGQKGQGFR